MGKVKFGLLALTVLLTCVATAGAQDKPPSAAIEQAPSAVLEEPLSVAVLDFETKSKDMTADTGEKVADLLTVFLSMNENLQLVERGELKKMLEELELSMTGIVDPTKATRVGALVGAQVLVTGRAFIINEKLYLTGKVISVETSRLSAHLAKGELTEDLDVIVQGLAEKLGQYLEKNADKMVAKIAMPPDKVKALRKALAKKRLPVTCVSIPEWHVGQPVPDPAAQTELTYLMRKLGIPVVEPKKLKIADWAQEFLEETETPIPKNLKKVDIVFIGEAFSEFAGRRGNLISVKARLEVKAVDTRTGRILGICAKTVTHVDLAEQIAGKTALQKAAGEAALEMLPWVVDEWNKALKQGEKQEKQEKQTEKEKE